jgi:predicted regulator of Ras-like GTPase activity (Roadblock/LC7/MglB family)
MNVRLESPLAVGLGSLFDLPGVHGSFLVTTAGDVAARALPEIVDDATLTEVSGRVVRLGETFQAVGLNPELCVLRFAEHKLYVKTLAGGVLCIITNSDTGLPALRMAANLVARKVGPEMVRLGGAMQAAGGSLPSAAAAPSNGITPRASSAGFAAVSPAVPPGDSAPTPGVRMYRGRPSG